MRTHSALLSLPNELRLYGLNVVVMDGWDTAQGRYLWTAQDGTKSYGHAPSCVLFHGTAGTRSRPVVRTRLGRWSVANAWVGLDDGNGTLYSTAMIGKLNRPTIVLTSSGPARWSAGRGYKPVLADMFNDVRPPLDAEGRDGLTALNRYAFSVENTHPNDGSPLGEGIFDHMVGLGVVLHRMFGWTERALGHRSWTRRKPVDPWFTPGGLVALQDDIQTELGDAMWIRDIKDATWAQWYKDGHITGEPKVMPSYYFADGPASDSERINAFNTAQRSMSKSTVPAITIETEKVSVVKNVRLT